MGPASWQATVPDGREPLHGLQPPPRLGQQFRAVGQNRSVANAAGINVNRVRLIAILMVLLVLSVVVMLN